MFTDFCVLGRTFGWLQPLPAYEYRSTKSYTQTVSRQMERDTSRSAWSSPNAAFFKHIRSLPGLPQVQPVKTVRSLPRNPDGFSESVSNHSDNGQVR